MSPCFRAIAPEMIALFVMISATFSYISKAQRHYHEGQKGFNDIFLTICKGLSTDVFDSVRASGLNY